MQTFKKTYTEADITQVDGLGHAVVIQHNLGKKWPHVACWVDPIPGSPPAFPLLYGSTAPLSVYHGDENTIYITFGLVYTGIPPLPWSPFTAHIRVSA